MGYLFFARSLYWFLIEWLPRRGWLSASAGRSIALSGLLFLFLLNVISISKQFQYEGDDINILENQQLLVWMKNHLTSRDVFMAQEPRSLSFLSGGIPAVQPRYYAQDKDFLLRHVRKYRVNYYISRNPSTLRLENIYKEEFNFQVVWSNARYTVYRILPKVTDPVTLERGDGNG